MRSEPNFGDLLLDRRPSHFVPPEMRDRRLRVLLDCESNRRFKPPIAHSEARQRTGVVAWVSRQRSAPNGDRWPTWLSRF